MNQIYTWKCYSYVQWIKYVLESVNSYVQWIKYVLESVIVMYSESNMYLKVLKLCTVNQTCTWKRYIYVQWIKYVLENVIVKNSDFPYDSWKVILAFKQTTIPC